MKNLLSLLFMVLVSSSLFAQGIIERNYSHYVDQEEVTHVYVSGKLFDMASTIASNAKDEDLRELSEFAEKIESFSLIKVPHAEKALGEFTKGMKDVRSDNYEELLSVRDEGNRFAVFVDEEDDIVYEVVGLGIADEEFIAFSLIGEMDLNKIADFINKADSEMLKPLKRFEELNTDQMKLYPNPTNASSDFNLEIPENMVGGNITIYDATGTKVRTIVSKSNKETIQTTDLRPGNYFVEISKESISMKKQLIVVQ